MLRRLAKPICRIPGLRAIPALAFAASGLTALGLAPAAQAGTYVMDNPGFTLTFNTSTDGDYSALGGTDFLGYVPDHVNKLEDTYYQVYLPQLALNQGTHWEYDASFTLTVKPGYVVSEGYLFMYDTTLVPIASTQPTVHADINVNIDNAPGSNPGIPARDYDLGVYNDASNTDPTKHYFSYDMEGGTNMTPFSEDNDGTMHIVTNDINSISVATNLTIDAPVGTVGLGQFISPVIALRVDRLVYSPPAAVPEPETWALMGIGAVGVWAGRRRGAAGRKAVPGVVA